MSLPRSRSAGELGKTPENGVAQNGETCEQKPKSKLKSRLGSKHDKEEVQKDVEIPSVSQVYGIISNSLFP